MRRFSLVIIILCTILAYINILGNQFVWDDQFFILEWDKIRSFDAWPDMLKGALPPRFEGAFRPGLSLGYLLSFTLFGTNPLGYHVQALAVHLLCTVLVYLIVSQIGQIRRIRQIGNVSFISALLFGLHPIHTEAVTYVAASFNTVGILFFLISFYLYINARYKYKSTKFVQLVPSFLFALLAYFTYEFTLTLPLVILLYEYVFRTNPSTSFIPSRVEGLRARNQKLKILYSAPYFLGALVYLVIRIGVIHSVGRGSYLLGSFYLTLLAMAKALVIYLGLLILPINQNIYHLLPGGILSAVYIDLKPEAIRAQKFWDPWVLGGIAALLIIILVIFYFRKKEPLVSFALAWFIITLLPASNLVPIQEIMAERYLYLPSVGFVLVVGYCLSDGISKVFKSPKSLKVFRWTLITILATSYLLLTIRRNLDWQDNLHLWLDTSRKAQVSEVAYFNLGNAYYARSELDQAIQAYRTGISYRPNAMGAWKNLGSIYLAQGKIDQSLDAFNHALTVDTKDPVNYINLAIVHAQIGQKEKAKKYATKAYELRPDDPTLKNFLESL